MSVSRYSFISNANLDLLANNAADHLINTGEIVLMPPTPALAMPSTKKVLDQDGDKRVSIKSLFHPEHSHALVHLMEEMTEHLLPGSHYYLAPKIIGYELVIHTANRIDHSKGDLNASAVCSVAGGIAETAVSAVSYSTAWSAASAITVSTGALGLPLSAALMVSSVNVISKGSHAVGDLVQQSCELLSMKITYKSKPMKTRVDANAQPSFTCPVKKAFIISGGSKSQRDHKYEELIRGDSMMMYGSYECDSPDEKAVVFSDNHHDFANMSCEVAKQCTGSIELPSHFRTTTFGFLHKEPMYGTIRLFNHRNPLTESIIELNEDKQCKGTLTRLKSFKK